MADEADMANDLIANEVSSVLYRLRQQGPVKMGPPECISCGETIPLARRELGFSLCVSCREAEERRIALFARQAGD